MRNGDPEDRHRRLPHPVQQVPLGQEPSGSSVFDQHGHRATPVRVRNTSSRVGRRSATSSRSITGLIELRARSPASICACRGGAHRATDPSRAPAAAPQRGRELGGAIQLFAVDARPPTTTSAPRPVFSSSGVPSAIDPPGLHDVMRSASWSASSRYCVVSRTVVPSADDLTHGAPDLVPAARVEPGGRFVEEQDGRAQDEARRDVEPSPHAARVPATRPCCRRRSSRTGRGVLHRGSAPRRAQSEQATEQHAGSGVPPRISSTAGSGRRARCAREPAPGSARRRCRRSRPRPRPRRVSVVRMRTAVVLPAPFGPSNPWMVPAATSRSKPSNAASFDSASAGRLRPVHVSTVYDSAWESI